MCLCSYCRGDTTLLLLLFMPATVRVKIVQCIFWHTVHQYESVAAFSVTCKQALAVLLTGLHACMPNCQC